MERVITYIDGFNLYFGMRSKGWRRYYWLDVRQLSLNILKPYQVLKAVRYFTSRISSSLSQPGQARRQNRYLEAIELLSDTTMYFGHYLSEIVQCRRCGHQWKDYEEKMTDVNIAVSLMKDAFQDKFDTAILISGDSDLTGPIIQIKELFPEKKVVVAFPPKRHSARLRQEAHASFVISRTNLKNSQFPDQVVKPDGYVLERPDSWK